MQAKTERFELRLDQNDLERVDRWREDRDEHYSRAEAVRTLIDLGLSTSSNRTLQFGDADKLMILMLCHILEALKTGQDDFKTELIKEAIYGGHLWGLKWDLTGIFHGHLDRPEDVTDVVNILDTWFFVESGFDKLTTEEKARVLKEAEVIGDKPAFWGFDGNNETGHLGIARFLIETMNRFQHFKDRELNSHMPTVERYRRMARVFEPMRVNLSHRRELSAEQLIQILKLENVT